MTIPWILNGPHIRRNHPLPPSVNITDTAATIAYLLALPIPVGWDEQPVLEAFLE